MLDTNTYASQFKELREQLQANPGSIEAKAVTVLHRLGKMLREAISALDMAAARAITDELGRVEVELGKIIATPPAVTGQQATEKGIGAGRG